MNLTPEQVQIIREATTDDAAFHRVISLFEDKMTRPAEDLVLPQSLLFNLDSVQVKLLSAVMNTIPTAIFMKDLDSRIIMANRACLKMIHYKNEGGLVGKTDFEIMEAELAQVHFDMEQDLLRTGIPIINDEKHYIDIDNTPKWNLESKFPIYDQDGKIVGLIGIVQDTTAQKLAEKSLETEHNLLQTLIDHIQDKIYVKDRESRFVIANAETLKAHYVSSEELMGTTDASYMPTERAKRMFEEEQRIMATGIPIINQELYLPPHIVRGEERWFLVTKIPIYNEEGIITGLVGVNHDITEVRLAEEKTSQLRLEQERIKILANFITSSSHEFRTPLSIINTSAYLLEQVNDADKREHYIERITKQTSRLTNLLDSLLLMSRLDQATDIEKNSMSLQSFLQNIMDQFQSALQDKSQTMHLIMDSSNLSLPANEQMLTIAISAILENALYHAPQQGEITLKAYSQDDHIFIEIQDNGVGMSEDTQKRIFERFYRQDEAHSTSGFGLGLPIALRIIELHEGHIEVESQINVGSRFKIVLPQ